MPALGAIAAFSMAPASNAGAQSSNGASMEIRLQAFVPVYCALKGNSNKIIISGTTDSGQPVALQLGAGIGGVNVECNTPYAMNLDRVTTSFAQNVGGRLRGARAEAETPAASTAVASVEPNALLRSTLANTDLANNDASNAFTVDVRLASRASSAGTAAVEQRCQLTADARECAVTGGSDDTAPVLARSTARFAIVAYPATNAIADAAEVDAIETAQADEVTRASNASVIPGALLGPMKPVNLKPANDAHPISTSSIAKSPTRTTRVLSEHLRLSVSGRY